MNVTSRAVHIAVLDDYHRQWVDSPAFATLRSRATVQIYDNPATSSDVTVARLAGYPIAVAIRERTRFDAGLLERLPDLELIVQTGNHVYHIDLDAATRQGVAVALSPGGAGGGSATAELTLGLILCLFRQIPSYDRLLHQGGWTVPFGRVLAGKTLGLVGAGRVARAVARMAAGFRLRILAWSPSLTPERAREFGAEAASLETIFSQADIVSVHLALTPETRGLVGAELLQRMKAEAIFINTSRGPIVDEEALVRILQEGRIAGAGLDVFVTEPLPPHHPLRSLDNVVLTPHAGWPTDAAYAAFAGATAAMIEAYLLGDTKFILNPAALEQPRPGGRLLGAWSTGTGSPDSDS